MSSAFGEQDCCTKGRLQLSSCLGCLVHVKLKTTAYHSKNIGVGQLEGTYWLLMPKSKTPSFVQLIVMALKKIKQRFKLGNISQCNNRLNLNLKTKFQFFVKSKCTSQNLSMSMPVCKQVAHTDRIILSHTIN